MHQTSGACLQICMQLHALNGWRTEKWDTTPGVKMACVFIYMHQTSGLCWHVCMQLHALNGEH